MVNFLFQVMLAVSCISVLIAGGGPAFSPDAPQNDPMKKRYPDLEWSDHPSLGGDLNCDGQSDITQFGYNGPQILVAIHDSPFNAIKVGEHYMPEYCVLQFPRNEGRQATPDRRGVTLKTEDRNPSVVSYTYQSGIKIFCKQLILQDGPENIFQIYWDVDAKEYVSKRR